MELTHEEIGIVKESLEFLRVTIETLKLLGMEGDSLIEPLRKADTLYRRLTGETLMFELVPIFIPNKHRPS
jgi:hypothetical protein